MRARRGHRPGPTPTQHSDTAAADPDDVPPPLYRDESTAIRSPESGDDATTDSGLSDETTILSRARERKRSQSERDPDATTLLPRTAGGRRVPPRDDDVEDDDLEADPKADRRRLLLMIGAVAVVAILGLVGGYAIIKTTGQPIAAPGPSTSAGPTDPGATPSGETSDPGTALITDDLMLSAAQAETIDKKRTWKVALTQRGTTEDSPHHPACLATDVTEGAPPPQQTVLRLLSSNGSDSPAALHQATSYRQPGGGRAGVRLRGSLPGELLDDRRLDLRGPSRRRGRRPGGRRDDPGAGRIHHRVPDRRPGSYGTDRRRDRRRQTRQGGHGEAGGRGGRIRGGHPVPGRRRRLLRRAGGPGRSAPAGWRPARVPRLG